MEARLTAHAWPNDRKRAWGSSTRICVKIFVKHLGFGSSAPKTQVFYKNFNTIPFGTPISQYYTYSPNRSSKCGARTHVRGT